MDNNLKQEIEKDFNKEKNYKAILSKVEGVSNMKNFKARYVLVPAFTVCILSIVFLGTVLIHDMINSTISIDSISDSNGKYNWIKKEIHLDESMMEISDALGVIPRWEEMTITQQFYFAEYDGKEYHSQHTEILSENVEKKLGTTILTGRDEYTGEVYTKNADLYEIKTISSECAIALQFEGTSEYYVYVNVYYRPTTLGELIEDLNLKEITSFGTVRYEYIDNTRKGTKQNVEVEFYDVADEDIWNMLLSDKSMENVYKDTDSYNYYSDKFIKKVGISVDIPFLGYKNISIELTDKGYLITNILGTGKGFYIGEEKVEEFIDYIAQNYQGYEIVYPDIVEEPEVVEKPEIVEDHNIIMYDLETNTITEINMEDKKNNVVSNTTDSSDKSSASGLVNYTLPYNPGADS